MVDPDYSAGQANKFECTIQHDVKVQGLEQRIEHLKKENGNRSQQLAHIKKQLKVAESEINKLNSKINEMELNRYITANIEDQKKDELNDIVDCLCNGIQKGKDSYSENVRSFCLTTHFYSPRAYEFIREKFNKHLPHNSTLRSWYRNSNIDVNPGIIKNALAVLKERSKKMKQNGKQLIVSLMFDEISIRKHIQWCSAARKFLGYITYGHDVNEEEVPVANQAIVFMISGLNEFFQIPIAYYFIKSLNAGERKHLLESVIENLLQCDIKIASKTFDGYSSNATMCEMLGATLKDDIIPTFKNPFEDTEIQIILDPSHAEKLVRSTLESREVIIDGNKEKIEWKYFVELVKYSQDAQNSYGLTHKLTKRHINFHDRKMCVRTAVELFSNSTADSMQYLMEKGVPEFKNAAATIKFIRYIDRLFDIMNTSRVKLGNIFKCAINPKNKEEVFQFLNEVKTYILSLKVASKNGRKLVQLVKSNVKTGFRGFVMNIVSVMKIYNEFVENQKCLTYIATYRLSQDHLEMFFGKIRSMHGCNDNPTVQQFTSAFKKLLHRCDV